MARVARLSRAFLVVTAGIVAGFSLYVGLIHAGVVPRPFAPVLQGDVAGARSDRPGARVLFVGNSMTYYNAMPKMVSRSTYTGQIDPWDAMFLQRLAAELAL